MNLKNTMLGGIIQTKRDTHCMSLFVLSSERGWNNLWWQREQCLPVGGWENNSKNEGTFCVNENVPYLDCGNGYTGEYIYHYSSDFTYAYSLCISLYENFTSTKRELIFLKFSSVLNVWTQPILVLKPASVIIARKCCLCCILLLDERFILHQDIQQFPSAKKSPK